MPEICGRICPQDRLCEGICVIEQSGHGTVTIGSIEKYITDTAWAEGWVAADQAAARARAVGWHHRRRAGRPCRGRPAAPQGLPGHRLRRHDRGGGLLIYGIPDFKLEKEIVERRIRAPRSLWHRGSSSTRESARTSRSPNLRAEHDTVLIATGVYAAKDLKCPGSGAEGVLAALDYLTASNRKGLGDTVDAFDSGELNAEGKHVVVIGGGDTAMDCVRTAVRQGAKSVTCLYRRDRANMPGSQREVQNAEEEGVDVRMARQPRSHPRHQGRQGEGRACQQA